MSRFVQQRELALHQLEQHFPSRAEEGIHEARVKAQQTGTVGFEIVEQDVSDPAVIRCLAVMADASRAALIEVTVPRYALPRLKQQDTGPTIYITGYLSALATSVRRWQFDPYEILCQEHPFHVAPRDSRKRADALRFSQAWRGPPANSHGNTCPDRPCA